MVDTKGGHILYKFLKKTFRNVNKPKTEKIIYVVLMIILFSFIYTFFENKEFAGWIDVADKTLFLDLEHDEKIKIFSKYAQKYGNFLNRDEFSQIPIVKINNNLHVLNKKTYLSEKPENIHIRKLLFDIYAHDNKMTLDEFTNIPIKTDLYDSKEYFRKAIYLSDKFAVTDYFDRLYYSATIQTTLGFGDIFPANKALRFFTMLQAISTIFIIVV